MPPILPRQGLLANHFRCYGKRSENKISSRRALQQDLSLNEDLITPGESKLRSQNFSLMDKEPVP